MNEEEKTEEEQTRPGGEFLVVAAKQKAHSNAAPSLVWYGGQACWSSVCLCAPVQTSSTIAAGGKGGTVGRVCLLTMVAGGQIALRGAEGEGGSEVEQVVWCHWLAPSRRGAPG